jgi:hypothetical protein
MLVFIIFEFALFSIFQLSIYLLLHVPLSRGHLFLAFVRRAWPNYQDPQTAS